MMPLQEIAKAIGARIRYFRELAHLTQAALGKAMHVSRQAIAKYEAGLATLAAERIPQLCEALHITPNDLLGRSDCCAYADLPRKRHRMKATPHDFHHTQLR
jgi:transcriptional regulator with XRE-family HTH domain